MNTTIQKTDSLKEELDQIQRQFRRLCKTARYTNEETTQLEQNIFVNASTFGLANCLKFIDSQNLPIEKKESIQRAFLAFQADPNQFFTSLASPDDLILNLFQGTISKEQVQEIFMQAYINEYQAMCDFISQKK